MCNQAQRMVMLKLCNLAIHRSIEVEREGTQYMANKFYAFGEKEACAR